MSVLESLAALFISTILVVILFSLAQNAPPPRRTKKPHCTGQLKMISLALSNYSDHHHTFPPAYLSDKNGRPMHSWRVLILPFLDREELYREYRFDEPWDGPNNRKLADQIGDVYRCPDDKVDPKSAMRLCTSFAAVIGDQTTWPGERGVTISDITDGTDGTLMIVEVADSGIHWMEPRDLHVLQMTPNVNPKSGQGISSRHKGGAYTLFADGGIHFHKNDTPPATLQRLLTINGGEPGGRE